MDWLARLGCRRDCAETGGAADDAVALVVGSEAAGSKVPSSCRTFHLLLRDQQQTSASDPHGCVGCVRERGVAFQGRPLELAAIWKGQL